MMFNAIDTLHLRMSELCRLLHWTYGLTFDTAPWHRK